MLRLIVRVDQGLSSLLVIRLVISIKRTAFLLSERHENDWAFGYDRVDDESGEHDDEDGEKGEAKVELAPSDISKRVLQKQSAGLRPAHLPSFLLQFKHDFFLL